MLATICTWRKEEELPHAPPSQTTKRSLLVYSGWECHGHRQTSLPIGRALSSPVACLDLCGGSTNQPNEEQGQRLHQTPAPVSLHLLAACAVERLAETPEGDDLGRAHKEGVVLVLQHQARGRQLEASLQEAGGLQDCIA